MEISGVVITNLQIKDLKIDQIYPIEIEGILIEVKNNRREISLPANMGGEQFGRWKAKGRGGVFYKDLFNHLNGKDHGKYIHVEGEYKEDEKYIGICRIIEDDELPDFEAKKLVNGKYVDKFYMELVNLSEKNESSDEYIQENQGDEEIESQPMNLKPNQIPPLDDEEAGSSRSISLFD